MWNVACSGTKVCEAAQLSYLIFQGFIFQKKYAVQKEDEVIQYRDIREALVGILIRKDMELKLFAPQIGNCLIGILHNWEPQVHCFPGQKEKIHVFAFRSAEFLEQSLYIGIATSLIVSKQCLFW